MAAINTPSNGDIWHLSIDDLFATLPDKVRLGGPGPFVINLSVSTAPIAPAPKFPGGGNAVVYQLQRIEDHRPRYRLRLGPFAREDDADAVLEKVRSTYPGALTATADADDLRSIAAIQAKILAPSPAVPPAATSATAPAMPPPATAGAASAAAPAPPPAVPARAAAAPAQRVTPGARPASLPPPPPRAAAKVGRAKAGPTKADAVTTSRAPDVESTRTVRALTLPELRDDQTLRWFVVQLSLSEEIFDSEAVPNLDIFGVYRLYSVAGIDQGRIVHALRLGFFGEEAAAGAVASYLSAFYDKPTVKRVSAAERERFADQRFEPRKDIGATGKHAVIEITDERYVRATRFAGITHKKK